MKRPFLTMGGLAAAGAVPLAICLVLFPGERSRAVYVYLLYLGAVLLFWYVRE